jgi:hypothetical protein
MAHMIPEEPPSWARTHAERLLNEALREDYFVYHSSLFGHADVADEIPVAVATPGLTHIPRPAFGAEVALGDAGACSLAEVDAEGGGSTRPIWTGARTLL